MLLHTKIQRYIHTYIHIKTLNLYSKYRTFESPFFSNDKSQVMGIEFQHCHWNHGPCHHFSTSLWWDMCHMKVIAMLHENKGGAMSGIHMSHVILDHSYSHWCGLYNKCDGLGWEQQWQASCCTFIIRNSSRLWVINSLAAHKIEELFNSQKVIDVYANSRAWRQI